LGERHRLAVHLTVELEEPPQAELRTRDRVLAKAALAHSDHVLHHRVVHRAALELPSSKSSTALARATSPTSSNDSGSRHASPARPAGQHALLVAQP
jgi:hypothetical protein